MFRAQNSARPPEIATIELRSCIQVDSPESYKTRPASVDSTLETPSAEASVSRRRRSLDPFFQLLFAFRKPYYETLKMLAL